MKFLILLYSVAMFLCAATSDMLTFDSVGTGEDSPRTLQATAVLSAEEVKNVFCSADGKEFFIEQSFAWGSDCGFFVLGTDRCSGIELITAMIDSPEVNPDQELDSDPALVGGDTNDSTSELAFVQGLAGISTSTKICEIVIQEITRKLQKEHYLKESYLTIFSDAEQAYLNCEKNPTATRSLTAPAIDRELIVKKYLQAIKTHYYPLDVEVGSRGGLLTLMDVLAIARGFKLFVYSLCPNDRNRLRLYHKFYPADLGFEGECQVVNLLIDRDRDGDGNCHFSKLIPAGNCLSADVPTPAYTDSDAMEEGFNSSETSLGEAPSDGCCSCM